MKTNRETEEIKSITLLELTALVLKQYILEEIKQPDMIDIVDELASCRAEELVKSNKIIKYAKQVEAFTCEICCDRLYVIKHENIDNAIRYAVNNIGEISIVYNDDIVVIGGYQDNFVYWGYNNNYELYKIRIGDSAHEEKNYKGIVYSTVDM